MTTRMLVTGGAGFMGSNFVNHVSSAYPEIEIRVLDALTYAGNLDNLADLREKIDFVQGSICDQRLVTKLTAETDIVVNFAAESHNDNSLKSPREFYETNVMGTFTIAEAARSQGTRLHHVSTDEVFGDMSLDCNDPFTEDSPYKPSSPYSASKAASDQLVKSWHRSFGLRVTVSNSANNYGPRQFPEKLIPKSIERILAGKDPEIFGAGTNVRDWLHVDDHSRAIIAILEKGIIGESYNISGGQLYSNLEIVGFINAAFKRPQDQYIFIEDRPGHDKKYFSSSRKLRSISAWAPSSPSIASWIEGFARSLQEKSS